MLNALILSWLQCFSDAVHPESFTHAAATQTEVHRCYAKLQLKVNETKSAVASVKGRKFLGYAPKENPLADSFWFAISRPF